MEKRHCALVVAIVLTMALTAVPRSAYASGYWLGRYWTAPHVRVEVIGLHNSYAGPQVGYRDHINFNVWITAYPYIVNEKDRQVANLHVSFMGDGCLYIWDSRTNREWERCVNWNSWNALYGSVANAVSDSVRDVSGVSIHSDWMLWLVAALFIPFLVFP